MKKILSIVINAHNENLLLHKTLRSIGENIAFANSSGISTEVVIVADKVEAKTKNYIETRARDALGCDFKIEYVDYGDLGLSRNHGINVSSGEYIANFDGDDIWSKNWLNDAVNFLKDNPNTIAHPAVVLNFGAKNGIWHIKDSTSLDFNPKSLIEDNWWPSCMMAHKSVFDKVQYQRTQRERQFSFEDWLFNCETLACGYEHKAVPGTVLFYRRKKVSMLVEQIAGLPTPNEMFTIKGREKYERNRRKQIISSEDSTTVSSAAEVAVPSRDKTVGRRVMVKIVKKSGRVVMKIGRKYIKPRIDSRYRLKTYLKTIKQATHTLIADPNTKLSDSRKNIPGWVREAWYEANDKELHLFPTHARVVSAYNRNMMTMGLEQDAYWSLAEQIGDDIDYIMVMPYIRKAGAYMVGMYYVKAYKQLYPDANVVVLTTENTYDSIDGMLPEGVRHVSVPDVFHKLSQDLKNRVLAKVFTYLKPKYVHALHSQEAFKSLQRYPAQISLNSKILLTTFNYDYTAEGQKMNAFVAYSDEILPYVTKVFTDNEWVAEDTVRIYGLDKSLVCAHAMPVQIMEGEREGVNLRDMDGKMRILWAARMAKQKRPDILIDIAKRALEKKTPVEFIVYGELYDNIISEKMLDQLASLPNVQYRGAFRDGIQKLPTGEFEVYLSTSEAEGTPNAILEAQEAGLLVIAPDLGGIPEAVEDGKTGLLVSDFTDIDQYIEKIKQAYDSKKQVEAIKEKARAEIVKNRSWDAFVAQFKKDIA